MLRFDVSDSGLGSIKDGLTQGLEKVEHVVATQIEKDTRPFVPALTQSLNNRTRVAGRRVVYPGPYARYLYHGKLMVDPSTGSSYAPKGGTKVVTDRNLVFNTTVHKQAQSEWFEASKAQNLKKWVRVSGKAVRRFG